MAQSRAARLAPVVTMAERAEREAALQLGHCQGLLRQAEVQFGNLERYRGQLAPGQYGQGARCLAAALCTHGGPAQTGQTLSG
jgi:flagellar FliJ protein